MKHFDTKLCELQNQVFHYERIKTQLKDLLEQQEFLKKRVEELAAERQDELEDVERLERHSLSSLFYKITGKKDEMLGRERKEAYIAAVKYDAAVREQELVEQYIKKCELELAALTGCEKRYADCLKEKENFLKSMDGEAAKKIFYLEQKLQYIEQETKEVQEAAEAGEKALKTADEIMDTLESADSWSTLDMIGGGILVDMEKYEELDKVQELVELLQKELHQLKAELADITIRTDITIQADGFLQFADYFFDGFFADLTVKKQIKLSKEQAENTKGRIQMVMARLGVVRGMLEENQREVKEKLEQCILQG